MAAESCAMISGFSGLPKLRQFVAAIGRRASAGDFTRSFRNSMLQLPALDRDKHQRPLPSSAIARPRFVPLMRMTPPSPPGPCTVLVCTIVSYCSMHPALGTDIRGGQQGAQLVRVVRCVASLSGIFETAVCPSASGGGSAGTGAFHSPTGR